MASQGSLRVEQTLSRTDVDCRPVSPVRIQPLTPMIEEEWDRFVFDRPDGSFFHLTGWKHVIEKTFGYQPRYVYAARDGKITGIAPLFYLSNWLAGRCLISAPLGTYGGVCAADEDSRFRLIEYLKEQATSGGVDYLELRQRGGGLCPFFHRNPLYVTFSTNLSADPVENFKRLPRDTRYMIRKAEKLGLHAQHGLDQMDVFYELFAQSMRRHGTPVFSRTLFENLHTTFGNHIDLLVVYSGKQAVSGVISFFFRDIILPYFAGAGPDAPRLAANNFMYWELMKKAAQTGFRTFDFGRSKKNTGSYAFKSQWKMTVEPLDYQVYLVKRKTVPNFSPANPKYELAMRTWRVLPLWLTKQLGPRVVRWIP
jgi:FemAB-related protein (PEP-CTERM system-associated)